MKVYMRHIVISHLIISYLFIGIVGQTSVLQLFTKVPEEFKTQETEKPSQQSLYWKRQKHLSLTLKVTNKLCSHLIFVLKFLNSGLIKRITPVFIGGVYHEERKIISFFDCSISKFNCWNINKFFVGHMV